MPRLIAFVLCLSVLSFAGSFWLGAALMGMAVVLTAGYVIWLLGQIVTVQPAQLPRRTLRR
ncbi:NADH:ubiquinone oxidoreductase subunit 4 (subunit M) [Paucibacter oligotrophus]|uniref:NADH:ubiquinone oxidoreductase subunit 4 (Subunit M) n=1 Tax=Roseateles oligotrophus TaxID=1769250 RepID=A0A840LG62_9BURK|nr:hypothetical protein [Roseateles oligotrophus]MBB4845029.1 NADH:ubiquinone oxidoreductase subunit 4 (subunit M) [Roseateles oligotrophus]